MSKQAGWAAFGVIAVTGLVIASCAIASSADSPREFIGKKYDCDADPTSNDRATCEASGSPDSVSDAISADTYPVDSETASGNVSSYECDDDYGYGSDTDDPFADESDDPLADETTDSYTDSYSSNSELCSEADLPYDEQTVYMQYEDDIVVVSKSNTGSTVDVYDYDDGYRSHSSHFAVFGWSSSGGGRSGGGWGGGFGGGK